ncbi:MAG: hypothetical protein EZS28_013578 [Streblomastix strix]|uniref:Uncharacterized protein n=1 Tax=Streblomastix strix TaxID=222440 RepID=A0A5J4W7Q0_9EUKA|nr:MAG: hypothetical protein EZS28_013578 [Streblomastix strix]
MSTTKNTNTESTYSSKDGNIQNSSPGVVDNANIGLVRNMGKQTQGQIRGKGEYLLNPTSNSKDWKCPDRLVKVKIKVNHDSTLMARSNMIRTLTNRQYQNPYSWRELSDSEPGE